MVQDKSDSRIFRFSFLIPVGGFRGPGPGKSSSPYDSLYFGVGELHFGTFGMIFGWNSKSVLGADS